MELVEEEGGGAGTVEIIVVGSGVTSTVTVTCHRKYVKTVARKGTRSTKVRETDRNIGRRTRGGKIARKRERAKMGSTDLSSGCGR